MREKRVDAVIGGIEQQNFGSGYSPSGSEPRQTAIAEHRSPAFYRIHYVNKSGRTLVTWRLADCDKHAVDLCLALGSIVRLARYPTRQALLDALPPGRSIRSILPPADLQIAHSLDLLLETDIR